MGKMKPALTLEIQLVVLAVKPDRRACERCMKEGSLIRQARARPRSGSCCGDGARLQDFGNMPKPVLTQDGRSVHTKPWEHHRPSHSTSGARCSWGRAWDALVRCTWLDKLWRCLKLQETATCYRAGEISQVQQVCHLSSWPGLTTTSEGQVS